ncbi:UNVERIFIED_CONTAM: hypothetical protein GTU68_045281 [Idotea baltica]|nr:hypothetical protein [Idotea baltica]
MKDDDLQTSSSILSELECSAPAKLSEKEINELKTRLLKESLSKKPLSVISIKSSDLLGPTIPPWLQNRQQLSLNFVLFDRPQDSIGPLGDLGIGTQEYHLIEDILSLMTGCQGTYITVRITDNIHESPTFVVDPSVEPSLKALVIRILPVCHYYSKVIEFIEDKSNYSEGTVNHALTAAMRNLLKDYLLLVTQLESQQMQGTLTLHRLWFYVEKTIGLMEMLACLSSSLLQPMCHGGSVLSLLYDRTMSLTGCGQLQEVLMYLTEAAAVPYMKMLSLWIYRGIIIDTYKEFMVIDNDDCREETERSGEDYADDYWEKRYSINKENVPVFLETHSDIIVRTGKYLNVIRESDPSVVCPDQEDIVYKVQNKSYIDIIEKTYSFASKRLLQLLMKEKDLLGHLRSMKHYFLLDQGDFVVQLLTLCESELGKNIDDVVPTRLESLLELALRTSSASSHTYKDNVHCTLLPYSLMSQMLQILSIETDEEREYRNPPERLHLTGLQGFSLTYQVEWPLLLVLDHKSHFCYQMIFRHLFYCKHVERLLCRVWLSNKAAKGFLLSSAVTYKKAFTLRQRMIYFIQNLEYYMNFEVIERNWQNFLTKVQKVENVDEVLACHSDFLNGCMKHCMLTSPELLRIVSKLTKICINFANFSLSPEPESAVQPEASESYEQTVARLDLQFTGMLITLVDKISDMGRENYNDALIHVLYRLDFNNYYAGKSEIMHTCSSPENSFDYNISG